MNMLQTISNTNNDALTMSTLDIAELTGKEHRKVVRDVNVMMEQLGGDTAKFGRIYKDSMNRTQTAYNLDKEHTLCLVSGYNVQLRMTIVKRWNVLEKQAKPKTPPTYATALLEAGRLALELENAEEQLALAAPKVEFYDSFVDAKELLTMEEAAKHLSNEPTTKLHGSSLVELGLLLHTYYMDDVVGPATYFTDLTIELCEVLCSDDKTEMNNTIKIMLNEFSNTIRDKLKKSVAH